MAHSEIPIANATDCDWTDGAFLFHFGAYGSTRLYVFANGVDSAFETAVEWLDDNAPGILTTVGKDDYERAAEELGYPCDYDGPDAHKIAELAEQDMSMVGHTTLQHGNAIPSWEWTVDEVDSDAYDALVARAETEA